MIKNKLNFSIGLFCLFCFVVNIINQRDIFDIVLTGVCAVANITVGLFSD